MFKAFKDHPNFILLTLAFALPFGVINSMGTLISNIYDPFGYSPTELALISLELCLFGVISTIFMGRWIDKTGSYRKTMIVWNILQVLISLSIVAALKWIPESKITMFVLFALVGIVEYSYLPLCFSYGAELTFPLEPTLVTGTITMLSFIVAFGFSMLGAFIMKEGKDDEKLPEDELDQIKKMRSIFVFFLSTVTRIIATIINCFIKEDLRRLRFCKNELKEEKLRGANQATNKIS